MFGIRSPALERARGRNPLELWGGIECTMNRVGDEYGDQLRLTGHDDREGDLDLLENIGFAALRYPVLWERVAARGPGELDWNWTDRRLGRLRELGIRPIAGLIHHGSGPLHTSLIDGAFAPGLASFAGAAARRYPWITEWTPVNEPLTTARFSCLYGHWYPHARDERLFWIALLNQIDATRLAMRAIRTVTPAARLIQTEDLGRTYATKALDGQAGFDNARRWMTWDLLGGLVVPGHDLWGHLSALSLEHRLRTIADDPCPPDVIGINHYLTSDRFLDHRLQRYPRHSHGGNAHQRYADIEAIRVLEPPPPGLAGAVDEAWRRYHLPIALTEVHNGCSRDEQLRWFRDAWSCAQEARALGVDLRAVTSWSLFGSSGWDTLLTSKGQYEPGAFDVRSGTPRPTALASLLTEVSRTSGRSPPTTEPGWWCRDLRLQYDAMRTAANIRDHRSGEHNGAQPRPILITGATGTLGQAMAAASRHRGLSYVLTNRAALDLLDQQSIAAALERHHPWAVINCGGWVRVDDAEDEADACAAVNTHGAVMLAKACEARAIRSVSFSSDLVFAGNEGAAYLEQHRTAPLNVYGQSKAAMEQAVLALGGGHLIVRTAAFFSPYDHANFAVHLAHALSRGEIFAAAADQIVTPTYVPDLCDATLDLLIDGEKGLWHLSNQEPVSWLEFGRRLASALGQDPDHVVAAQLPVQAARPRASALASERGALLPSLESAIGRFASVLRADRSWDHIRHKPPVTAAL